MLKSRNIFIDTQAFHQNKFRFDHPTFKRLLELCKNNKVQLVLTDSVVGEVDAHLKEQLAEASKSLGNFHKLIGPITGYLPEQYLGLLSHPSEDEIIKIGVKAWEAYLRETKAIIVSASIVDSSTLLRCYFSSQPPFGPGRKKYEFPDAISVLSLEAWLQNNKTNIYVVSQDSDLESWCAQTPSATHIKSLAEFIDTYNRTVGKLTELTHKLFIKENDRFLEAILTQFREIEFHYDETWDAEVEIDEVHNIQALEVNVIDVEEDYAVVVLSIQIEFTALISGTDYDNGIWDSEEKKYLYLPSFSFDHTFKERFEVSVEFSFDAETEEVDDILSIEFEDGRDISLSLCGDYPYK